ncbi:MAG: LptF/LptG family permease [Planctomycetes bacterium]|nr:LptF/LptG family permease [Planctomycetota bacterium]
MRIVHRQLFVELVWNALFSFVVLTLLVAMLMFSLAALQSSKAGLGVESLTTVVALLTAGQASVILPMSILVAAIWTYARARADGELTAMRGAGISLWHLIQPALLLGASGTFLLVVLQDELLPDAAHRQREITKQEIARNLDRLLQDGGNRIQDDRYSCDWGQAATDEQGFMVFEDFVVADRRSDKNAPHFTRAKRATPAYDPASGRLSIKLEGLTHSTMIASRELTIELDLRGLYEDAPSRHDTDHLHYDELITLDNRIPHLKQGRKAAAELHRRAATSFSATLFALLGALMGISYGLANRAVVFALGFLLVLVLGFGPTLVGMSLAKSGTLGAGPALWMGNVLLALLVGWVGRRAWAR